MSQKCKSSFEHKHDRRLTCSRDTVDVYFETKLVVYRNYFMKTTIRNVKVIHESMLFSIRMVSNMVFKTSIEHAMATNYKKPFAN